MSTPPPSPPTPPTGPGPGFGPGPGTGHSWPPPSPLPVWGPPPAARQPSLNGFALASVLVGLLCFPPLGIVFAVVALVQTAGGRQRGRALAVVGLVVSVVMSGVLALTADRFSAAVRDRLAPAAEIPDVPGELTDIDGLRAGDCFNVPGGDLMTDRPRTYRVDCAQEHHGEITLSEVLDDGGVMPGSNLAEREAESSCWKAQDAYAMDTWALPESVEMYYFAPSRESWREGDRRLLCVIGTTAEEQKGSLHQEAGALTPGQAAFLRAANAVEQVIGARSPMADVADTLSEHQAWAREAQAALAYEAEVLGEARSGPGMEKPVRARLKEIETARLAWQRASQARTATEFDVQWGRALRAMSVETEKALRGAYGLSTQVPWWAEEGAAGPEGGWGGGPPSQQV
ncbi:septum formation family protein [Streptomyces sp. NPDC051567]|uniref:DUF4190 domain-containing protein n=1 Tax=Streptomyces sp. NPDC051567 TaxID=3365660 RepID=UPI003793D846